MPLGLTTRPTVPDVGAVGRSLVGVLLAAVVAVQFGSVGAATAAAGAAAIAGATALQDSPRGPARLVVAVSGAMGLAVLLGALTAAYPVPFVLAAAAWSFGAGMLWALGGGAGLVAVAAGALLVASAPVPPTFSTVFGSAALVVAGGLVQAGLIAIWPRRRWRTQRAALTRAYRSLGADARRLSDDGADPVDTAPLMHLREAFTLTDRQAIRRPPQYRGWYGLPERIAISLTALTGRESSPEIRELLAAAADALSAIAAQSRPDTESSLRRVGAAAEAVAEADSAVASRLSAQLTEAAALRLGDWQPGADQVTDLRRPDVRAVARHAIAVMRGHLDRRSPILRHAIRLSVAVGIGVALDRMFATPHDYWIPLTVLMVLRPETAHTYTRCAGRLAGNAAGIVVASVILMIWHPTGVAAAVLAVICLGLAYAASSIGYVALSGALAATIVFVVEISGDLGAATLADRLVATIVGGGLAVIAHVALPDDALIRLRQRAGELLRTEIDYAATVVKAFVHDLDHPTEALAAAWQRAFRARAAFEAASGATRLETRELRYWLRSFRTALNVVTSSCTTLEASLPATVSTAMHTDFVAAVDDYVDTLRGTAPNAATPWSVDLEALLVTAQRVREIAAQRGVDDPAARVLVAEIATITRSLTQIAAAEQGAV